MLPGAPGAPAARAAPPDAAGAAGAAAGRAVRPWRGRGALVLRRHWLVSALLAAGLVLRVLALAAYHPALIYVDSLKYLYGASPGSAPLGYTVLLRLILLAGDLGTVAAAQHLLGLAMALALYAVLLRRDARTSLVAQRGDLVALRGSTVAPGPGRHPDRRVPGRGAAVRRPLRPVWRGRSGPARRRRPLPGRAMAA